MRQAPSDLVHGIYQSLVDGGTWPELLLGLADHVTPLETVHDVSAAELMDHFDRADALHVQMNSSTEPVQDTLRHTGPEICLIDHAGVVTHNTAGAVGAKIDRALRTRLAQCEAKGTVDSWVESHNDHSRVYVLVPKALATQMGMSHADAQILLTRDVDLGLVVDQFSTQHELTRAERQLLGRFLHSTDLRQAAKECDITYETSRKYLKSIYSKSGYGTQAKLIRALLLHPLMMLPTAKSNTGPISAPRRLNILSNGHPFRYFTLGPETGRPIFYIDGIRGGTLDCIGGVDEVNAVLKAKNIRLIANCQAYSSKPKQGAVWQTFAQFGDDLALLFEELGVSDLPILSHGYGASTALGLAHARPDLFSRLMLVSASCPEYKHPNWREMDFSYHLIHVVARKWPQMLDRIMPLLARSMRNDIDRFNAKSAQVAKCAHERAIFTCPLFLERSRRLMDNFDKEEVGNFIEEIKLHAAPVTYDLAAINVPIKLFHGDADINAPLEGAQFLAAQLPNATLHILPDMGHHMMVAEWDRMFPLALDPPTQSFAPPKADRRGCLFANS
ncbi:serine aminopeptidase domain-containing protein [Maritalea sp. S77]|uniref:serine aminopeptidase domain-containing protein n=1 Tax=Maritalea sp. S77 TaxID=3415125 RepID=UPI003C7A1765